MTVAQRIHSTVMAVAFGITVGAGVPIGARAAAVDWPTFGFSNLRQGTNPNETTIGAANVASLVPKWSFVTQGVVTAQPLLAHGVVVNGTPKDLLIVGDNNGHLFALDAQSTNPAGTVVWTRSLGFLQASPPCLDLPNNHFGIIGSPAISRTAGGGAVFVGANGRVYAFQLATGTPVSPWPAGGVAIPKSVAAKDGYIYGAVTLANSSIYVATAGACDHTLPYHGQIAKFGTGGAFIRQWFTIGGTATVPTKNGGGIWGPGGVAVDAQSGGALFAATGNALPESVNCAEDIVKLSSDLTTVLSDGQPPLQGFDVDFGATSLLFTANGCTPAVVAVAKSGEIVVYWNRNNLINPQRIAIAANTDKLVGIPAWDSATQLLFVTNPADSASGTYKRGLLAFHVQGCKLVLAWQTTGKPNAPAIANFTYLSPPTVANGVAYFGVGGTYQGGSSPPNVYAISEQTGHVLWKSTNITAPVLGPPMVVNGRVFVGTFDNKIVAYGLHG